MATIPTPARAKHLLRQSIVPVIAGDGLAAHLLALRLFFQYRIVSFRCGQQKSIWDSMNPTEKFFQIYGTSGSRLAAEQLIDLADAYEDCLFVLIWISEEDRNRLKSHISLLESRFILTDAKHLFDQAPFSRL